MAVGRDYADVPPTRGIYKGQADDELNVGARVALADAPQETYDTILPEDTTWSSLLEMEEEVQWQQQQ